MRDGSSTSTGLGSSGPPTRGSVCQELTTSSKMNFPSWGKLCNTLRACQTRVNCHLSQLRTNSSCGWNPPGSQGSVLCVTQDYECLVNLVLSGVSRFGTLRTPACISDPIHLCPAGLEWLRRNFIESLGYAGNCGAASCDRSGAGDRANRLKENGGVYGQVGVILRKSLNPVLAIASSAAGEREDHHRDITRSSRWEFERST